MFEFIVSLAAHLEVLVLAQAELETFVESGIDKLTAFTILIAVAGISIGGFLIMRGQIEFALYVIIGALVVAGAYPIASSLFELSK